MLLKSGIAQLVLIGDLRDIQSLFQDAATRCKQQQIVVDQRGGHRLGRSAGDGPPSADQAHAAVAADL